MSVIVRRAGASDAPFLAEMLVAAAFWRPHGPSGSVAEVLNQPELAPYITGWPRPDDLGVIALAGQHPVGAAWVRLFPEHDRGYGFVDAATPELSMAVVRAWRRRGIGFRLLDALIAAAREQGLTSLSLSVEPDNDARRLYERVGFQELDDAGGSLTMLLRLQDLSDSPDTTLDRVGLRGGHRRRDAFKFGRADLGAQLRIPCGGSPPVLPRRVLRSGGFLRGLWRL